MGLIYIEEAKLNMEGYSQGSNENLISNDEDGCKKNTAKWLNIKDFADILIYKFK